jgi:NTP pyrophosphatase (non-canonical NTP hydrolase)
MAKLDGTKFGFIMGRIMEERHKQEEYKSKGKFTYTLSDIDMSPTTRLTCVTEEIGEVAREVLGDVSLVRENSSPERMRDELVQVIALCVAWLEIYETQLLMK